MVGLFTILAAIGCLTVAALVVLIVLWVTGVDVIVELEGL